MCFSLVYMIWLMPLLFSVKMLHYILPPDYLTEHYYIHGVGEVGFFLQQWDQDVLVPYNEFPATGFLPQRYLFYQSLVEPKP